MKWIDYREKLGIGFHDQDKFIMFRNKIQNLLLRIERESPIVLTRNDYFAYSMMVGEYDSAYNDEAAFAFRMNLSKTDSLPDLISKYIAFCNTLSKTHKYSNDASTLRMLLEKYLSELSITYTLIQDDDGFFVFPKGAPELDSALVSEPLEWLSEYPSARTAWVKALTEYSNQTDTNASEIADKFRKALEAFFQEFFCSGKSLENYKAEYGTYLKNHGIPKELSGNFQTILESFSNYINNYAKHHDSTSRNVLEYIMYQTGNIIRLLITLKQEETEDAD